MNKRTLYTSFLEMLLEMMDEIPSNSPLILIKKDSLNLESPTAVVSMGIKEIHNGLPNKLIAFQEKLDLVYKLRHEDSDSKENSLGNN